MAKKKGYRGGQTSHKTQFNPNLYRREAENKKQENPHMDRMAYYVYLVCAVMFAICMVMSFLNQNYTKGTVYLILTFVALALIRLYHRKVGK